MKSFSNKQCKNSIATLNKLVWLNLYQFL